ncbi:hypothetical protein POKO110462_16370 [Pontibacter korlensis]|uniref:Uncharacterized protein n=1 Tax=Pontibacter korlensis TaxID=400092 RepID=A0A0E3ZGS5_9BACT|nr:hypothetical protein [Pontibacter korlensis]AKD04349.1 hypothetical protein PKOR_16210 [Pontibacter korlensis]
MNTLAIIISIIALLGAGFAFLRAASAYNMLTKRINKLQDHTTDLERRLRRLEGNASRGNRQGSEQSEGVRQKKQRQEQQGEQRQQQRQAQQTPQAGEAAEQQKRRKNKRRKNETIERLTPEVGAKAAPASASSAVRMEFKGGDLLDELEKEAGKATPPPVQPEEMPDAEPEAMPGLTADTRTRFAIIPEDGMIRQHQLQQNPDSDSYIEMDLPADGSNTTRYRFNLSGNHAFVIAQGMDRLENAFSFEKPSNRMVSRVVLQGDGILTKVNNDWKIQEKARIDFR